MRDLGLVKFNEPIKRLLTQGMVTNLVEGTNEWKAMSKSLGNALYPNEIVERWGADLLRLWVASVEYQADVKMSERVMTQLSEAYRKIRNTFRFALGNLADFDPSRDTLPNDQLEEMDRWMLERTAELVTKSREWYAAYDFHRVYHAIHDFCVVDLSAFYFDVLKDRLYTKAAQSKSRRSAQTAVWKISSALVRLIAPELRDAARLEAARPLSELMHLVWPLTRHATLEVECHACLEDEHEHGSLALRRESP